MLTAAIMLNAANAIGNNIFSSSKSPVIKVSC